MMAEPYGKHCVVARELKLQKPCIAAAWPLAPVSAMACLKGELVLVVEALKKTASR